MIDNSLSYFLEYQLMGQKIRYKLQTKNNTHGVIPLRKLKLFYFFAHSHEDVNEGIANNPNIIINLVTEHKQNGEKKAIGNLELSLKSCLSTKPTKKDFYKFFSIENVSYGWGLEGSLGLIPSQ